MKSCKYHASTIRRKISLDNNRSWWKWSICSFRCLIWFFLWHNFLYCFSLVVVNTYRSVREYFRNRILTYTDTIIRFLYAFKFFYKIILCNGKSISLFFIPVLWSHGSNIFIWNIFSMFQSTSADGHLKWRRKILCLWCIYKEVNTWEKKEREDCLCPLYSAPLWCGSDSFVSHTNTLQKEQSNCNIYFLLCQYLL